VILEFIFKK